MKRRTLVKGLLIAVILMAALLAAAWFTLADRLSHLDAFRGRITTALEETLHRHVAYKTGTATLSLSQGLSLHFTRVVIREKDLPADLLRIESVFLRVKLLPLLGKRVVLGEVVLNQPRFILRRNPAGVLNIADLLAEKKTEIDLDLRKITVQKGSATFMDQFVIPEGLVTSLDNLAFQYDAPVFGRTNRFRVTANLKENENRGDVFLAGSFRPTLPGKPGWDRVLDVSGRVRGTDIRHYWPYIRGHVPFTELAGRFDVDMKVAGTLSRFAATGSVSVKDALLSYPAVFRGPLKPRMLRFDYAVKQDPGKLAMAIDRLTADRILGSWHLTLKEADRNDPFIEASVKASDLSREELDTYIPWGVIDDQVSRFIDTHIRAGNFPMVQATLKGRVSEIAHMERQGNAGVLHVQASVEKGVFAVKKGTPDFTDIKGLMEIKNRQFSLRNLSGRFGSSPVTLEGGISDFALPGPIVYTADMTMKPERNEVLWLIGKEKFRNLSFSGPSTLHLSGRGTADHYPVSARWDLTHVAYAFPDVMNKPPERLNRLSATFTLSKDAVTVSCYTCDLAPVTVTGSVAYHAVKKLPLSLNVRSNTFDIREVVSIFPALQRMEPAGKCRVALSGQGDPQNPKTFHWKGDASFTDLAFRPSSSMKPVTGLTGQFTFKGDQLETSPLTARLGDSTVQGKCRVKSFKTAEVACDFSSPLVHTADLGFHGGNGDVDFRDVKGLITASDNRLHINALSLMLNRTSFNVTGDIRNFDSPKISLALTSPYINGVDVARLMTMNFPEGGDPSSSPVVVDASIQVATGTAYGVDFGYLRGSVNYSDGILHVRSVEADILNGTLTGNGRVVIRTGAPNRYEATISLDRLSLDKLQGLMNEKRGLITGTLTLHGDLAAEGRTVDDLKKTAAGTFQVRAAKGVLKKYPVLSKIFSVLNVSQLLNFKLPDMVSDGMPYDAITAGLDLKDGILSTKDFLIDSDAMEMSAIGTVDLFKDELTLNVGVYPLETVDWIVARIPIAGWVLTNEGGHLVSVYFDVDGKMADPRVTPIPVRSMAQGTLNMFRRLFNLPEKLFTDTGDVILGK